MPDGFQKLTVSADQLQTYGHSSIAAMALQDEPESAEAIAKRYLQASMRSDSRPVFLSINQSMTGADQGAEYDFRSRGIREEALTNSQIASFEQVVNSIPVFGSKAEVAMGSDNSFRSSSMTVVDVGNIKMQPTLDALEAKARLTGLLKGGRTAKRTNEIGDPVLTLLPNPQKKGALQLVWHFVDVEYELAEDDIEIPDGLEGIAIGGCTAECRSLDHSFDYFLDAHSGEVVYLFPNSAHVDVPTHCSGQDEDGTNQTFYGRVTGSHFEMNNPFEDVQTKDLQLNLWQSTPIPVHPVRNPSNDWQNTNPAAVSAHINATRVIDFLFRILRRNSIDDAGMTLLSIVNCTDDPTTNVWVNAMWNNNRMWYGQVQDNAGVFRSLARYLDIVAHELFHGITQHTANLVYSGLSGALNESFSDIFGVIIRNWYLANDPADVATWDWNMGPGLGANGNPMRSMSDPNSVGRWRKPDAVGAGVEVINGYPDHMDDYVVLPITRSFDYGGVHWFSNIHNFAAYKLLVAQRVDGSRVFAPSEIAILYYLVLTKLGRLSVFSDAKDEMIEVSEAVYAGNSSRILEAKTTIETAYDDVGI